MVPSGTPGSFIAAMRQCRSDRQRQHISAAYPWNTLPWQHIDAMRPRAAGRGNISTPCVPEGAGRGNISPWCVFGRSPMAKCSRNAFPSVRQWQDIAAVRFRGGVQSWRDIAAMRSRAAIRGSFFASCVPEGASDGKSAPSWQHIAAVHPKRAGFGKIFASCIRKAPQAAVREYTARRSCHEGALFAARAPQIMHGARVLPSFGA